ncbi:CDP-alcohol phosphatidyltransferase family protein [Nocardioides gansuensis]|uniref:CDP-alcohol phosphatidyltransferase family protein n=1 Tax=Nocardioides gansuensis TaxID=2138300 RepID=UPI001BAAA536|nr:CDP-alcohol phosphatidyltransferase family protein [Nocardioides gansuensis]
MASGPGLAGALAGLAALLAVLAATIGLGTPAAALGLACGVGLAGALRHGLAASGTARLGPADLVTLTRAALACGIAALVADAYLRHPAVPTLVTLTVVALVLDAVDGRVARQSGTASAFGARFDGEADAFLILVLSVYIAREAGAWVLAIGTVRYVFGAAGWLWPWMGCTLPFRDWRKVVTAVQGIVLCVAAADVLPDGVRDLALVVALALLAESFGRDVVWLWLRRAHARERPAESTEARLP